MVRETRHLWVGNLPDNIREDRIREHFKRYGRVQNVKLLGRTESASAGPITTSNSSPVASANVAAPAAGASGVCATVAFMDIKSASKAHNAEHVLDEYTLTTEYYEPAAIPSAAAGAPSAGSSPAGSGYSGSSSSMNSTPGPTNTSRFHLSGGEESNGCPSSASVAAQVNWRGTNDSATEYCRRGNTPAGYGRYPRNSAACSTPPTPNVDRTPPGAAAVCRWEGGARRRSGSEGSSSSSSPSDTSRASSPPPPADHHNEHLQQRSSAGGRPLAICVRNLPARSTDSSLKDGLYHEYKKHGKVVWVKVVGQNADRYAIVRFKKPSDVDKALEVSQDKLFFGCKISVAPHQSCDEDAESAKPFETDIDEYHPKATRTLFIGNLEKDVTQQQLREKFKHFGRIIEIDIKKGSSGGGGYAFCQYASISSVVEAIRAMDGEYVGASRVKLGFGKPVATTCVWVDGLTELAEKQVVAAVGRSGAATAVTVDRAAGAALVHFDQATAAAAAVRELRRLAAHHAALDPERPRLAVDYASRECQDAFYEQLEKHGGAAALAGTERLPPTTHHTTRYESGGRSRSVWRSRPRYSVDHYDTTEYADHRYRVYDEIVSSPQTEESPFEERLQSVVVSPHRARRHRRDSSPDEHKHSKERHRSSSGTCTRLGRTSRRRSGSGSRRRHRRRHGEGGSRAGTPLRDEPLDTWPADPRLPPAPRDRSIPLYLPLPKFGVALRAPVEPPVPRPPSAASSSSAGSAPHSPSQSLEERIRSLDEKYEKWSRPEAPPERARPKHRLLELDINEVKPSDVVRSLLAKRSVFDEDSERLEGAGSSRPSGLLHPFPTHDDQPTSSLPNGIHTNSKDYRLDAFMAATKSEFSLSRLESEGITRSSSLLDILDKPSDPRLSRLEKQFSLDRLNRMSESDLRFEPRMRPRTPSTESSSQFEPSEKSFKSDRDTQESEKLLDDLKHLESENTTSAEIADTDSSEAPKEELQPEIKSDEVDTPHPVLPPASETNHEESSCDDSSKKSENLLSDVKTEDNNQTSQQESDKVEIKPEKQTDSVCEPEAEKTNVFEDTQSAIDDEIRKLGDSYLSSEDKITDVLETTESPLKTETPRESVTIKKELKTGQADKCEMPCPENPTRVKENKEISNAVIEIAKQEVKQEVKQEIKQEEDSAKTIFNFEVPLKKELPDTGSVSKDRRKSIDKVHNADKVSHESMRSEREKPRSSRDKYDQHHQIKDHDKRSKHEKSNIKHEKDRKMKEEPPTESSIAGNQKNEHDSNSKHEKTKHDKDKHQSSTHKDEKSRTEERARHDHHKRDKSIKDKRRDSDEHDFKHKKDDKHKSDRHRKEHSVDSKRDVKKESESKSRKSSRDESSRELYRKDSTDSTASRASHESNRNKEHDNNEIKDDKPDSRNRSKSSHDKHKSDRDIHVRSENVTKSDSLKIKTEIKQEHAHKPKAEQSAEHSKTKLDSYDKQRHHSVDSPSVDNKRKERLNSSSSLPSNIGQKRRISYQDNLDSLPEDVKKLKSEKISEKRNSRDTKSEKPKVPKFNKEHFAKLIESKTKDEKKNQVKPPDDVCEFKVNETKCFKFYEDSPQQPFSNINEEKTKYEPENDGLQNHLDFLATLELRVNSSEEDEKTKALRREMKEKKRLQQLQQIQELQMQQDALQQAELKDKKLRDEKRKEMAREKRMSTDRKSKDEKSDSKRKSRKPGNSSDTTDSDEPKKHSIFDIVDDEPTYISMYDKVKARSCKNMQKQEEEKRQEKIKAKFSQLKQSRAKREEKKRCSWDEDSDSDQDTKKHKSIDSTSEDDVSYQQRKLDQMPTSAKIENITAPNSEDDSRNKLSRKNSRSRILSDTSDEDSLRKNIAKSIGSIKSQRKDSFYESGSLQNPLHSNFMSKQDSVKNNSLINLFGKSDSDDCKNKSSQSEAAEYKGYMKMSHDFSSENESIPHVYTFGDESRKKHKKKLKKSRSSPAEDENKHNFSELHKDLEARLKGYEKSRKHSKKDKRKEKLRESFDTDDTSRDEKFKTKDKTLNNITNENKLETSIKDGKMEDIFGPLSDESDSLTICTSEEITTNNDYHAPVNSKYHINKLKEKDEYKRRKEKKRKEKRTIQGEDENSLDVDAVSKAIEARLFSDDFTEDEELTKNVNNVTELLTKPSAVIHRNEIMNELESLKREGKEKKKKKKRNREDRNNHKEHHSHRTDDYHFHKIEDQYPHKSEQHHLLKNNEKHSQKVDIHKNDESHLRISSSDNKNDTTPKNLIDLSSCSESPSLPRLTDSPVKLVTNCILSNTPGKFCMDKPASISNSHQAKESIDKMEICPSESKKVVPMDSASVDDHLSNDKAVQSISNFDKVKEQTSSGIIPPKHDEKVEEKPRAIISQEETEDAVAALLGESFGGGDNAFRNHFDDEDDTISENIQNTSVQNDILEEEDAEEMRRAVQNLNASELEMKPDTPVSDCDLLQIDTDTEDADDTERVEKPSGNVMLNANNASSVADSCIAENKDVKIHLELNDSISTSVGPTVKVKIPEKDLNRENIQIAITTTTPVMMSSTLSNNKLCEPYLLNVTKGSLPHLETTDSKNTTRVTANIIQIRAPHTIQTTNPVRSTLGTPNRVTAPYQVINQVIRPQNTNMQPPIIKIPDQQIVYQKPHNIVISPRMSNDPRLMSPKGNVSCEPSNSPRMKNVTILSTSPQNITTVGLGSPNSLPQRSPSHLTVVRMQQPPLSPIQAMHIPPGTRAMVSPNRPNSVLVQTQGPPLNFNRSTGAPVLAPISKPVNTNILQTNKLGGVTNSVMQQKGVSVDRRNDISQEGSRIIFSTANLQHSTNPTVMAQNRLISMQNALHVGNINTKLQFPSKVLINSVNTITEKSDGMNVYKTDCKKSETQNSIPFGTTPIIRVAGVNTSANHLVQTGMKNSSFPMTECIAPIREMGSNVIHSVNQQRILTTAPLTNVIQIDANKGTPSVLSMTCSRTPSVLTKLDSSAMPTSSAVSSVVMAPVLVKTSNTTGLIRTFTKPDLEDRMSVLQESKDRLLNTPSAVADANDTRKDLLIKPAITAMPSAETVAKCETDFEELLRENTNKIKVTKDPNNKLEVSDGRNVTIVSANTPVWKSLSKKEDQPLLHASNKEDQQSFSNIKEVEQKDTFRPQQHNLDGKHSDSKDNKVIYNVAKADIQIAKGESQDLTPGFDESQISEKQNDENDSWSAKDVNIESVIKKVDSLCNDIEEVNKEEPKDNALNKAAPVATSQDQDKPMDIDSSNERSDESSEQNSMFEDVNEVSSHPNKRGGRTTRGKRPYKNADRVQTRQISKPARGGSAAKRGRGRAIADKKRSSLSMSSSNLPGDVYDFHEEDSGDESANATSKSESRPRLILTIKSPISNSSTTPASNVTGAQKEIQPTEKPSAISKDEKTDEFASPSLNTRKSRRLLEKDVQKTSVEDGEDGNKSGQTETSKGKKRPTRQAAAKQNIQEKGVESKKTNRGMKRTRNTSSSDASLDSNDEKNTKKEDSPSDAKIPKLSESAVPVPTGPVPAHIPVTVSVAGSVVCTPVSTSAAVSSVVSATSVCPQVTVSSATQVTPSVSSPSISVVSTLAPSLTATVPASTQSAPTLTSGSVTSTLPVMSSVASLPPVVAPTPIMKPPKKMISEISAKLAGVGGIGGMSGFGTAGGVVMSAVGAMGAMGSTGAHGVMGAVGPNGAHGAMGAVGPTGAHGAMGAVGPMGPHGAMGASGPTAAHGAMGVVGPTGAHGAMGAAGPTGSHSAMGAAGLTGVHGAMGAAGPTGAHGAMGAVGPTGAHGAMGASGPTGAHGAMGAVGPTGAHGALGAVGAMGGAGADTAEARVSSPALPTRAPPRAPHLPAASLPRGATIGVHHHHPATASRISVPHLSPQGSQIQMSADLVRSPPPAHQQTSPVTPGDGMYPHFSHQHYQMYQQQFRNTLQDARTTPSPYTRCLEAEGSEAPPLELRRPPSARVPRPAHSPAPPHLVSPAPHDRLIMMMSGGGRSPPPAHGGRVSLPAGPPHASQVPREADSLQMLLRRYPVMWQGLLALKNDAAAVQMHFVGGNPGVAGKTLPRHTDGSTPPLRIAQRMRLEPQQLDQVHRKMKLENEHCMLLALPCGRDHMDVLQQSTNLSNGFITYLQQKQAAGIVNIAPPGHQQALYTVHIFPSCEFANENLNRIAPDLMHRVADIAHLLIVIATV